MQFVFPKKQEASEMPAWNSTMDQLLKNLLVAACFMIGAPVFAAEDMDVARAITGSWVINEKLSDKTDDKVAKAIKESGGKPARRWFKRDKEFYRGGPAEQELYDRISYDPVLTITYEDPEIQFIYADNYLRVFYTDGRKRRSTANSFYSEGSEDFSFANWDGSTLVVEARPRDGGFTLEKYTMNEDATQLRVEMVLEPDAFGAAIELVRVYDRAERAPR